VNSVPGKPSASGAEVCAGEEASLTAAGTSLKWYDDKGLSNQVGTGSPFNPVILEYGFYNYYVTQTVAGCEGAAETVILQVNPVGEPSVLEDQEYCDYESEEFHLGSASENGQSYLWTSEPPGFTSSIYDPVVSPVSNMTYILTLTVDSSGCQSTDTVVFTVHPSPVIEATPPETYILKSGQQELTASGADVYAWDPESGLSAATGTTVTASPGENMVYVVTGTSTYGCSADDTAYVYVYCESCTEDNLLVQSTGHISHGCTNNNYNDNASCSWLIYPDNVSKIYLQINPDSFDVRSGDWLRVYDGPDENAPLLGEYNNASPPSGTLESGNTMFVKFSSDGSGTGTGFQASYTNDPAISTRDTDWDVFSVYPNPNKGRIRIAFSRPVGETEIMIFNSLGKRVLHREVISRQTVIQLDLTHLPQGLYYLQLTEPLNAGRIIIRH
jgi:hypothetical protein